MFTGLVQAVGVVRAVEGTAGGVQLRIDGKGWDYRPRLGDSIAVNGCCLTLAAEFDGSLRFDVVHETLSKTTLAFLKVGSRVNLEKSLAIGDLMGGHQVQGHVDRVGTVERIDAVGGYRVWVRPPAELMKYMVPRGAVCLDGVSLTLAEVDPGAGVIQVALIPTTLEKTTLREWAAGTQVNIEADAMAKTIVHYLQHFGQWRFGGEGA